MPIIKPSSEIRNNYNEISDLCHKQRKPVYITRNGTGDLAVLSIEEYEFLIDKIELYESIQEGINDANNGKLVSSEEAKDSLKKLIDF